MDFATLLGLSFCRYILAWSSCSLLDCSCSDDKTSATVVRRFCPGGGGDQKFNETPEISVETSDVTCRADLTRGRDRPFHLGEGSFAAKKAVHCLCKNLKRRPVPLSKLMTSLYRTLHHFDVPQ